MASGKHSKRLRRDAQAKTPPPVHGGRAGTGRSASPKVLLGGGAVLVAAVVAVVLVVTLTGGGKSKPPVVTVDLSAVGGIPQNGLVLGNPLARVTLTEYVDTSCPICQDYVLNTFPTLSAKYVKTGKVKIEARVVAFVGPSSSRGRQLVLAAAHQNKAWQLLELLYQNQGNETQSWLTDSLARAIAAKIPGLDVARLFKDADSGAVIAKEAALDSEMKNDQISGTPTFLLTTPDGKRHFLATGSQPASAFENVFDRALSS
jgi:protein-disulfide isomerase